MMKRGNYAMLKRMCVRGKCHPLLRGKVRTTLVCPPIFCIIFPFSFTLVLFFFSQRLFFFSFPLLAFSPFLPLTTNQLYLVFTRQLFILLQRSILQRTFHRDIFIHILPGTYITHPLSLVLFTCCS